MSWDQMLELAVKDLIPDSKSEGEHPTMSQGIYPEGRGTMACGWVNREKTFMWKLPKDEWDNDWYPVFLRIK